jgi:two-component system sensor histidine kinase PilS (NtrC family)
VSDDERTLTGLVLHESDRLSRLLTEFLDFARVRVVRLRPVDLGEVARNAARRNAARLVTAHPDRKESVRITCEIPQRVSLMVDGDEDVIHRAVFNLLLNAVQASPEKAEVRVEVTPGSFDPLPVGVSYDSGTVALRVTDEGSGIDLEIRDRMFDPFFTTKPGGSGLGLAVVQRAVEAHRGLVFVDSATRAARNSGAPPVNVGTRFTIVLPRTQPTASGTPPTPSVAVPAIRPSFPLRSAS